MKTLPLLIVLVSILASCSKNESLESPNNDKQVESSESQKTKADVATLDAEVALKKEATLLSQGLGSDENLLRSFNNYLTVTGQHTYTQARASNLRAELFAIFNNRIDMYLNMLNASLEGKRSTINLEINDSDPSSAYVALQTLYNSLGTKKSRTQLTLAEQYLVFDITIFLKKKFATQNQETIPSQAIVKFLKEQISSHKKTPGDAFFAYQVANEILDSNDGLYTVFYPILSQVKLSETSGLNEVELFKRISMYALDKNLTDFIHSEEEAVLYFSNVSFIASNKIDKLQKLGFDQRLGYFETLDYAFKSFNAYLGKVASENALSIPEVAAIQDQFIQTTYFDLLKSLNKNTEIYSRLFQESCLNFKSSELDLILKAYTLTIDQTQKVPCISYLKDKVVSKKFEYITDLNTLMTKELAQLSIIERQDLRNYFTLYNKYNLSNLILNIVSKNGYQNNSESGDDQRRRHEHIYNIYESTKNGLKDILTLRENKEIVRTESIQMNLTASELYLPAGIYVGNIQASTSLLLHPLALITTAGTELKIEVNEIFGGRIDGNYKFLDYSQVLNREQNQNIYRGAAPSQNGPGRVLAKTVPGKFRCYGGKGVPDQGADGRCIQDEPTYIYSLTRSVNPSANPGQAFQGLRGLEGATIKLKVNHRVVIETPLFSNGLKGYKGNQGLNAPTCNSSNEYQVYRGIVYSVQCEESACPSVYNAHEGSRTEFHSYAGVSGNGGQGGPGGKITISTKGSNSSYPALSLGGLGGVPGDRANCSYPGQGGLIGSIGPIGQNGSVEVVK